MPSMETVREWADIAVAPFQQYKILKNILLTYIWLSSVLSVFDLFMSFDKIPFCVNFLQKLMLIVSLAGLVSIGHGLVFYSVYRDNLILTVTFTVVASFSLVFSLASLCVAHILWTPLGIALLICFAIQLREGKGYPEEMFLSQVTVEPKAVPSAPKPSTSK